MPGTPSRRFVHTRSISVRAYARDDGLWDLEAELTDVKEKDFALAVGVRKAGDPVHAMRLHLTIDTQLNVLDASATSAWVPYPGHCDSFGGAYRQLIGLNLARGFRHAVNERLGGTQGCTHLTELAAVLPTAAIQAFAGEIYRPRDEAHEPDATDHQEAQKRPFQLDRCRALRVDGPAVAQYYARWYTGNRQNKVTEGQGK